MITEWFYSSYLGYYNDDLNFGGLDYHDDLTGDRTAVDDGCGATLMGQFWYFGGYYSRQVNSSDFYHEIT